MDLLLPFEVGVGNVNHLGDLFDHGGLTDLTRSTIDISKLPVASGLEVLGAAELDAHCFSRRDAATQKKTSVPSQRRFLNCLGPSRRRPFQYSTLSN
jgi:hypothetical protein